MNEKNRDIQANKMSRLQFLRLLGICTIGFFAYRVGRINSLFGNATAAGGWLGIATPQRYATSAVAAATTAGRLDEDGILHTQYSTSSCMYKR